ncbi:hypothetical protein CHLRE_13g563200v5 [Chlamydomonas reinhardtii]|uniref:Haloacid dehalogenase-like hydrolase n=1 Tax=Chlamydomonas reinhardtii TaxID=3055 RepID=A8HR96_CHLRE|nr:uncharacterized protein CHLRE_13g563200v5 [Chlamydomonas reinhardtii]PNW73539.1 hypothetical protein CHLRE_13g563200v5 [Chlamydomonas reinhardtii]|eukprot:XP_001693406.1 predicted protein [Chlamydomonas reinhardtii]
MAAVTAAQKRPVLLLDIMDTVVYDPFFKEMPVFFNMSFKELLAAKHPTAWVEFECGEITEEQLLAKFFADGRHVDGAALKQMMVSSYRYLDGMPELLRRLGAAGYPLHACSNYPAWWRLIEDKLAPSQYLAWSFVSCEGPMKGFRKPSREAFEACLRALDVPAAEVVFVDDRAVNVEAAAAAGLDGILFEGAEALEAALRARGLQF